MPNQNNIYSFLMHDEHNQPPGAQAHSSDSFLIVESKVCFTCKSIVREQESPYFMWQGMCFCDIVCLHWYHKQNLPQHCSNCFVTIQPDFTGKLVFRFDKLLQFCAIPCFRKYQLSRKSCLYCMGKIYNFACNKQCNSSYCTMECEIKHKSSQGYNMSLEKQHTFCGICKSNLYIKTIFYQPGLGEALQSVCNYRCLQNYAFSLQVSILQCASCRMYFSPGTWPFKKLHKGTSYIICSKKCENKLIFSNLKVYSCANCNTQRFDIDLIQRCSKIEPLQSTCSISCYLKKYCVGQSHLIEEKLFSLDKCPIVNRKSISKPLKPIRNQNKSIETFENAILTPIIEENESAPIVAQNCFIVKRKQNAVEQKNIATMCSVQKTDKGICAKPKTRNQSSQTEPQKKTLVPVRPTLYVPAPVHMYPSPTPSPVPFSVSLPVPIFLQNTKNKSMEMLEDTHMEHSSKWPKADILPVCGEITNEHNNNNEVSMFTNSLDEQIGLCAWKQWIKSTRTDLSTSDILMFPSCQLADCLALFVSEIRKPSGNIYAPDTIFYLCLSLQKYIRNHDRSDNIFFDECYGEFVKNLDKQMKKFSEIFLDSSFLVTRVEEEHLWESQQLGDHSPYSLLNTVLYHNMKFFHLMTVEDNISLCRFKFVRKKKTKGDVLCFYPNLQTGKCYEMPSNYERLKRCPLMFFILYCSKLSTLSSEKMEHFYFKPNHCSLNDHICYSSEPLDKAALGVMINRLIVVRELHTRRNDSVRQ